MTDIYSRYDRHQRVCFIYNYRCTAACTHCNTESTPQRVGKLDLEEAIQCLDIAAAFGRRLAIFSGGEVFLFYKDLLALVEHATLLGLETLVETNSYWAVNEQITRHKLTELRDRGLSLIHTSADVFHSLYVPLDRVLRMARVARALELPYEVCFLYSGNRERDEEILRRLEEEGIRYSKETLFPFGAATRLPNECFYYTDVTDYGDCGDLQPTVDPDGNVVACCNINIHRKGSPLFLGNIHETSFTNILEQAQRNLFMRTIHEKGFRYFHKLLKDDPVMGQLYKPRRYATICEYCNELFSDPERVAFFKSRLSIESGA